MNSSHASGKSQSVFLSQRAAVANAGVLSLAVAVAKTLGTDL